MPAAEEFHNEIISINIEPNEAMVVLPLEPEVLSESPIAANINIKIRIFVLSKIILYITLLATCLTHFRGTWHRSCDYHLKAWTVVTLSKPLVRAAVQISTLKFVLLRRYKSYLRYAVHLLDLFSLCWFFYGIKPIFVTPRCDIRSWHWGVSLWSVQSILWVGPSTLLCLCLPCLVLYSIRTSDGETPTPTPDEIIKQLTIKKYEQIKVELKDSSLPSTSPNPPIERRVTSDAVGISQAINGVCSITGLPLQEAIVPLLCMHSFHSISEESSINHPLPAGHGCLKGNCKSDSPARYGCSKDNLRTPSCPICYCVYEEEDDLILMPCDERHVFHIDCISSWLQKSQFCPICRRNVVEAFNSKCDNNG